MMQNDNVTNPLWCNEPPKPVMQIPSLKTYHERIRKASTAKKFIFSKRREQKKSHRMYCSSAWQNVRDQWLREHPIDQLLLDTEHKVVSAEHVHHIVKFFDQPTPELQWSLMLDPDNLISLSSQTHTNIHYRRHRLTEEQIRYLEERKDALFEKYFKNNIIINIVNDANVDYDEDGFVI